MAQRRLLILLLSALAWLALFAGCTYEADKTSATTSPTAIAPEQTAPEDGKLPRLVEKVKAGADTRYVLDYQGLKYHIIGGDLGLFAVKLLAPQDDLAWDSLWMAFNPRRTRPRTHTAEELVAGDEKNLDYVPEELRDYVVKAQELALYLTPRKPATGNETSSLPKQPTVITGVNLSPVAANELAIFARTDCLYIAQNLRFPAKGIPAELSHGGLIKYNESLATGAYTPKGEWFRLRLISRGNSNGFLVLQEASGDIVSYAQTPLRGLGQIEETISNRGGFLTTTFYTEQAAEKGLTIPASLREAGGILLALLDADVLQPPADLRAEAVAFAMALRDRERVNDFVLEPSDERGIDHVLKLFETGELPESREQ